MDSKELRDKQDRDLTPEIIDPGEISLDKEQKDVCPTCGSEDIQSAELLLAWKDLEDSNRKLIALARDNNIPGAGRQIITIPPDVNWQDRYAKIKAAYVRTRLEVSGSFGNWDYNTRKRVLEHEISTELGFTV